MQALFAEISDGLLLLAHEGRAKTGEAYLKNKFRLLGVNSTDRNLFFKALKPRLKEMEYSDMLRLIAWCWEMEEREYQYLAIDIWKWKARAIQSSDLPQIEHCITHKSWWDSVDLLASNTAGTFAKKYPEIFEPTRKQWIQSDNIWLNRSAMIFQLKWAKEQRTDMLAEAIIPHLSNPEFFLQKAIGWSLRQMSKFYPNWVIAFLEEHQIQGLALREASKYL